MATRGTEDRWIHEAKHTSRRELEATVRRTRSAARASVRGTGNQVVMVTEESMAGMLDAGRAAVKTASTAPDVDPGNLEQLLWHRHLKTPGERDWALAFVSHVRRGSKEVKWRRTKLKSALFANEQEDV